MSEPPSELVISTESTKGDLFYTSVLTKASEICAPHKQQKSPTAFVAHVTGTSLKAKFDVLLFRHSYSGTSEDSLTVDCEGLGESPDENWSVRIQMNDTFADESVLHALRYGDNGGLGPMTDEQKQQFVLEFSQVDKDSVTSVV